MKPKQEEALRDYLRESIVPLIEDVLTKKLGQAITFATEELKAPVQEPVAWADMEVRNRDVGLSWTPGQFHTVPLYTTPPAAPDLQAELDATNKQVEILSDALAESRREVAALTAVQEPITWLKTIETLGGFGKFVEAKPNEKGAKPVYLIPPAPKRQWVGLTDDEMQALWDRYAHMEMMRAIEAKLKEKNT